MNIEQQIAELTEALKENTAALREILSVGAVTAADTLVPTPAKKRASKAAPLEVIEPEPAPAPEPETPFSGDPAEWDAADDANASATEPEPVEETPQVPDLPVAELRAQLKPLIQGKLLADTEGTVKATFDALRAKYGVSVIKELTDDQVAPFYAEVLTWE